MKNNLIRFCFAPYFMLLLALVIFCMFFNDVSAQTSTEKSTSKTIQNLTPAETVPSMSAPAMEAPVPDPIVKKKVLATAFVVSKSAKLEDVDDIAHGFPRELISRLALSRKYVTKISPGLLSFNTEVGVPSVKLLRQLGTQYDSQFVISGEVRDDSVITDKKYLGLIENKRRFIDLDIDLYDTTTGVLLSHHTLSNIAQQDVIIGRDKAFGSGAFLNTTYGKAIDVLIDQAAKLIIHDLDALPAETKMTDTKSDS
ncbi:hypothetical protein AAKU64_003334 [Undibacterium sp. GrIS 1.8]|uniref:flagella assembly protein FlgT middle domain-containing protein n=1 Tax=unclassified Undibacterium TaxID=2630295 RepID=UPI003390AC8D